MKVTFLLLAFIGCSSIPAWAQGLLHHLPKDGTWAQFEMTETTTWNASETRPSRTRTASKTFRISSVGTEVIDGQKCRWIEFRTESVEEFVDDRKQKFPRGSLQVDKLLIPEKNLAGDSDPLKHVLRSWRKSTVGPQITVEKVSPDDPVLLSPFALRNLHAYLHGPLEGSRSLDPVVVVSRSSLRRTECPGIAARERIEKTIDVGGVETPARLDATYTVRLHPQAPFGVMTWDREVNVSRTEAPFTAISTTVTKMRLTDFGEGAKSELPEFDLREPAGQFLQKMR